MKFVVAAIENPGRDSKMYLKGSIKELPKIVPIKKESSLKEIGSAFLSIQGNLVLAEINLAEQVETAGKFFTMGGGGNMR